MIKYIFNTLFLVTMLCSISSAQNFSRLENLAVDIKDQAQELIKLTSNDLKRDEMNSRKEIEGVFLAEQLFVSAKLIQQMVNNKRILSELRYAGSMLTKMSTRFPMSGTNSFEWKKASDLISEISRELRGMVSSEIAYNKYEVDKTDIIGRAYWNGMVDSDVQISVRKAKLFTKTLGGKSYSKGIYSFTSSLPNRSRIRVGVKKKKGRGKVHVIQQPNRSNGYTAIIEILDSASGAKSYSLEIYWYRR